VDVSDLGACLRALRRRADLSQRELAQRAGVPQSTVSRLESGDVSNPRLQTLKQIVEAADCVLVISPEANSESRSPSRAVDSIEPVTTTSLTGYLRAHGFRLVSRVAATFSIDLDVLDT
jgi:transcriptional regulator with XRE-family HTH domain